jgi:hypothetical protein
MVTSMAEKKLLRYSIKIGDDEYIRVVPCTLEFLCKLAFEYMSSNSKIERDDLRDMAIRTIENLISLKDGVVSKRDGDPIIKKIGLEKMVEVIRKL